MPYPIQLVLDGVRCLVVGGGKVAVRKVRALRRAGAVVHVVSPRFEEELLQRDDITRHEGPYRSELLAEMKLVMVCTDDRELNARVCEEARAAGVLVNVADDPAHCDFYVPAVVRRGPIQVAIGTGGASPELAATVRRQVEASVPEFLGAMAEQLRELRPVVKARIGDQADRAAVFAALCGEDSIARFQSEGQSAWRAWAEEVVNRASNE